MSNNKTLREEIEESFYEKYPKEIVNPQDVIAWACAEIESRLKNQCGKCIEEIDDLRVSQKVFVFKARLVEFLEARILFYESKLSSPDYNEHALLGMMTEAKEILAMAKECM